MIEYSVVDSEGKLLRTGTCPPSLLAFQVLNEGERVIEGIVEEEVLEDVLSYRPQRKALYPPLEEFADAKYWESRGNPVPLQEYYAKIDLIKQQIPKNSPI